MVTCHEVNIPMIDFPPQNIIHFPSAIRDFTKAHSSLSSTMPPLPPRTSPVLPLVLDALSSNTAPIVTSWEVLSRVPVAVVADCIL